MTFSPPTRAFNLATRAFCVLIREFELVTRRSELITCGFELGSGLVTREIELVTRRFELLTPRFEFVTHRFELATRGFVLETRTLLFHAYYADDSTIHTSDKNILNISNSISHDFTVLSKWLYNHFMVQNPDKCSIISLDVDVEVQTDLVCENETLKNSKQEKVLDVDITFENKLNFATHLINITKIANSKFNLLTRVQKCMIAGQKKLIFSSFIKSQFFITHYYCPLIWTLCATHLIGRINNIHKQCLNLFKKNYPSILKYV